MPVFKHAFQMVSSPYKNALYAIGGWDGYTYTNVIFKFQCMGDINACRWTKSETTLRFGRSDFVAIPIPYSLADKLCSTDRTTAKPPNSTTKPTDQCDFYDWIGDGECDDATNNAECNYDGGDCCDDEWIGDGECDDATNNVECGYDGGDCCGDDVKTDHCDECICYQT